jgi:ribosomal protein L13E
MKYSRNELLKLNNAPFRQLPPDFTIPAEITRSPSSTPEAEKRRRRRCARLFSVKNCELDCIAALYYFPSIAGLQLSR